MSTPEIDTFYPIWEKTILSDGAWHPRNENGNGDLDYMWLSVIGMSGYSYWAGNGEEHSDGRFTFDECADSDEPEATHTLHREEFPRKILEFAMWVLQEESEGRFTNPYPINFARKVISGKGFGGDFDQEAADLFVQYTVLGKLCYS